MGHLVGENFVAMANIKIEHVPYKGASQALTDLVGGHIVWCSQTLSSTASFLRAGTLERSRRHDRRARCPTGRTSRPSRSWAIRTWWPRSGSPSPVRRKLPPDIVKKMNEEIIRGLKKPEVADADAARRHGHRTA